MIIGKSKFLFFLCLVTFLCPGSGSAGAPEPMVLKMNHQFPATTPGSKIDQWFADQIKQRTQGKLFIKIFWSNGLGEPRDNLSLISRGVLDMAGMSPGYFPKEMPLLAAPNSIPMAMDTVCQARDLMEKFIEKVPAVSQEATALGIRPLFFHVLNPYLLVTTTPVTQLSHLKEKRIRTWGNDMPSLIRAAKGKPVPLFLPDVYAALEKGIIDGCPFSLDLMVTYELHKVARHVSEVILWEGPGWGVWISELAWNKLSIEFQNILTQTAKEASHREILLILEAEKAARETLKTLGVTFHPFPKEELDKWKTQAPDYFKKFIQQMDTQGKGGAAQHMVDLWQSMKKNGPCP